MVKSTTNLTLGKSLKFISETKLDDEITSEYQVSFSGVTASLQYIVHPKYEILLTAGGHILFQRDKGKDIADSKACGWIKEVLIMITKDKRDRG